MMWHMMARGAQSLRWLRPSAPRHHLFGWKGQTFVTQPMNISLPTVVLIVDWRFVSIFRCARHNSFWLLMKNSRIAWNFSFDRQTARGNQCAGPANLRGATTEQQERPHYVHGVGHTVSHQRRCCGFWGASALQLQLSRLVPATCVFESSSN